MNFTCRGLERAWPAGWGVDHQQGSLMKEQVFQGSLRQREFRWVKKERHPAFQVEAAAGAGSRGRERVTKRELGCG